MKIPTIHLNGTPQKKLYEDMCAALGAMRVAVDAVHKTRPHGRDYYPQGIGAMADALAEHEGRMAHLRAVLRDLEQISEGIADQGEWPVVDLNPEISDAVEGSFAALAKESK